MSRVVPVRESRLRIEREPDGVHIHLNRRRPWWRWLIPGWGVFIIGFGLVSMLVSDDPGSADPGFVALWVLFGLVFIAIASWGLVFREELVLDTRCLTRVIAFGPFGSSRSYDRIAIEDLRVSSGGVSTFDPRAGFRMYGIGGGTVAFDYGDRTIRVADVEEAEAKRVIAALKGEGL